MSNSDRNLGRPEMYVPLEGGLWICPACEATNTSLKPICGQCGQLVRHRKMPPRVLSAAFFLIAGVAVYLVSCVHLYVRPASSAFAFLANAFPRHSPLRVVLGGFNPVVIALVVVGLYFLLRRPTGRQYLNEPREQRS